MEFEFNSRRSPVFSKHGIVASSQPLATVAGVEILRKGGNAASAAISVAATLNVTEPTSTGIGGDVFVLYYQAKTREVFALNGSGRSPQGLSLKKINQAGMVTLPPFHPYTVTVPGACAAWFDLNERFGNRTMEILLEPAIALAIEGFPVTPITAYYWQRAAVNQLEQALNGKELLINGNAPLAGQIFCNNGLARTFQLISKGGKDTFYQGEIAQAIVRTIQEAGGVMQLSDLAAHTSDWVEPIRLAYQQAHIWECPPNGQGLAALIALNILNQFDLTKFPPLSSQRLHLQIEAMRLAFADAWHYIADPKTNPAPVDWLLSSEYAKTRSALISPIKSNPNIQHGVPPATSDTVYFCVVDAEGNACSFINSNYMGFGTGIVPSGFGFSLQNRGHNFSLQPGHANQLEPGKRPYHTIIPALATHRDTQALIAPFGVMGGFMQPQGHMQVAISLFLDQLNPQTALDLPRFCIEPDPFSPSILIEEGIPFKTIAELAALGHPVKPITGINRSYFGRGQIITKDPINGVLCAGSDPRADGCAMTY
ncbi:MAG: gamma-glutamyltransferase [Chloroflexi bacterium HGW-Chloroflexi-10]|nr:MAG: gamma-glutamyltransferase [Chloroflexi bacterium HGW-Chloroflexi-10]